MRDLRASLLAPVMLLFGALGSSSWAGPPRSLPEATVRAGAPLRLELVLPAGFKINPNAPNRLVLKTLEGRIEGEWRDPAIQRLQVSLGRLPAGQWLLEGSLYICEKKDARICATERLDQPLRVTVGSKQVRLRWRLEAPQVP